LVNDNRLFSLFKTNCSRSIDCLKLFFREENFFYQVLQSLYIITVILLTLFSFNSFAKVQPPNYDFTLNKFDDFIPGTDINKVKKKFGKGVLVKKEDKLTTLRFNLIHVRYKFPITVQVKNNKITDFMASLPSYFLHNVFHQSLINKYGKQDQYHAHAGQGVYIWNKKPKNMIIYEGGCSITCHPISFSIKKKNMGDVVSVYDELNNFKKPE